MSGVLSALAPNSVIVLTDGAVYRRDGSLLAIKRKVAVSERVPLAVAFRGNFAFGELTSRQIIQAAETVGFDRMLAALEADLPNMPASPDLEMLIAGISETAGPMHRVFRNKVDGGFEALKLIDPGLMHFGFGGDGRAIKFADFGVPAPRGTALEAWFSRYGASVFEFFRHIPVAIEPENPNTDRQHLIGGILDMTVVTSGGVSISRLHQWPDQVGEKIDPLPAELVDVALEAA